MQSARGLPGKRKRGDHGSHQDEATGRPSPHQPANMQLAQHGREQDIRQRQSSYSAGRRQSRGGRGGHGPRHNGGDSATPATGVNNVGNNRVASPRSSIVGPPMTQSETKPVPNVASSLATQQPEQVNASVQATQTIDKMDIDTHPNPELDPYVYDYVTDDKVASWKTTGRQAILDAAIQDRFDEDAIALSILYQELIHAAITGRLEVTEAGTLIRQLLEEPVAASDSSAMEVTTTSSTSSFAFDARLLFLDTLSTVTEIEAPGVLRSFVGATGIDPGLLRRRLEVPLLEMLGLVRSTFSRMSIRKTTNLLYRQSNYNLLREESEGYSKLKTELFTTSENERPSGEVVEATFERVKALIGAFDLDVGRVLDVVLDVFASVLVKQYRFYVKFLRISSWWPEQEQAQQVEIMDNLPPWALRVVSHRKTSEDDKTMRKDLKKQAHQVEAMDNLPPWALPGVSHWQTSEDDKTMRKHLKKQYDRVRWDRVSKVGIAAFFEAGRLEVNPGQTVETPGDKNSNESDPTASWVRLTGTLPPSGNRVAAQLLGFKLRFYASDTRESTDFLPINLIFLAALLIKIGFISLVDLYPHLWPEDDKMEAVREQKMKEKAEREKLKLPGGGAANALMMAGALPDDDPPARSGRRQIEASQTAAPKEAAAEKTPAAATEEKEKRPEPTYQKVLLLQSLLCIGALPEALFMLGRYPWLPDAFPELLDYIHRLLHYSLDHVFERASSSFDSADVRQNKPMPYPIEQDEVPNGQLRFADQPPRRILRWALPDQDDKSEATDYRFYWDEWSDNIPMCETVDDVFLLYRTLGAISGVRIGTDACLLAKLVRIGRYSLTEDTSAQNTARWIDLCKRLLVPALSLTTRNPGVVNEVYELLKMFPTATRYSIYAEWYSGAVSRLPDIKSAFDLTRAQTKDILRRINKTDVKPMARALAKVAYASPGIVFSVAIGQIESYDNLVEIVVECARYLTYLGYDVLTWSLLSSLGRQGRDRVQADGMLTRKWLATLSRLAGRLFKRYSSLMNPTPVLQYVAHQLRKGNTADLIVLKEMITSMAGIISDTDFQERQILALAGGPVLRQQTLLQLLDKRHECRTSTRRFIRSMTEPPLAGRLLVSIAQLRRTCMFAVPDAHTKILGNLTDEIHRVLTQYMDLLRTNLTPSELNSMLPDVVSLISDSGIEPAIAFWISRTSLTDQMKEADKTGPKDGATENSRAEVVAAKEITNDVAKKKDGPNGNSDTTSTDVVMKDVAPLEKTPENSKNGERPESWHPVLSELMDRLQPVLPKEMWASLSPAFYATFWQLTLHDVSVPFECYEEERSRLGTRVEAVRKDRSDMSTSGIARREREKKHLEDTKSRLQDELKSHIHAFSETKARLRKKKDHWFADFWGRWDELNDAIISFCLVPRMLVSPADAYYCFKMLKLLHSVGTANFRTMGLIDHLLREGRLSNLMFMCTAREAENLARFLSELFKELSSWHADKAVYEKEAFGAKKDLPGFAKKLSKDKVPETHLGYEDFRRLLYKWHKNLNSALKACLTSHEYMHIRNALIILKGVNQYFPVINWIGRDQVTNVTEISKSEKREDLKVAAMSLLGSLKKREKQWMLPQAFNLIEHAPNATGGASAQARSGTPQPAAKKVPALNPAAPSFQSKPESNVNGTGSKSQAESRKHEAEEGEIDDTKAKRPRLMEQTTKTGKATSRPPSRQGAPSSTPKAPTASDSTIDKPSPNPTQTARIHALNGSKTSGSGSPNGRQPSTAQLGQQSVAAPSRSSATPSNGPPPRPDVNKQSSASALPPTVQHSLPKRPDIPSTMSRLQDRRLPERHPVADRSGPGPQDQRSRQPDRTSAEYGRLERQVEPPRETPDRRQNVGRPASRGSERPQERGPPTDRGRGDGRGDAHRADLMNNSPRIAPNSERSSQPSTRDPRTGPADSQRADNRFRERSNAHESPSASKGADVIPESRNSTMPPPRTINPVSERPGLSPNEPDRRQRGPSDRDDRRERPNRPSTPGAKDERRGPSLDGRLNARRDEPPPSDGRRRDEPPYQHERRRDEQQHVEERRSLAAPDSNSNRSRNDHSHTPTGAPTGPRGDRFSRPNGPGDAFSPTSDRPRDQHMAGTPAATHQSSHAANIESGRSHYDQGAVARPQDPNYGRLNASPGDIPSGPRRGMVGRGNRSVTAPQPPPAPRPTELDTRNAGSSSQPTQGRQPPTGPSNRSSHRSASGQFDHPFSPHSTAPSTPATGSMPIELAGMHPDRLKSLQRSTDGSTQQRPPMSSNETGAAASNATTAPPHNMAPSGPRGAPLPPQHHAATNASNGRNPPAGTATATDRGRGGDKRFADLPNILQQGAGTPSGSDSINRSVNIRGRGGRSGVMEPPSPSSRPDTPSNNNGRPDLVHGRPNGLANSTEAENNQSSSRGRPTLEASRDRADRRRSARTRSRSPSRDREHSRRGDDRPPRREEHRDRRSGGGGGGAGGGGEPREARESRGGRGGRGGRGREEVAPGGGAGGGEPAWGGDDGGERRDDRGRDRERERERERERDKERESGGRRTSRKRARGGAEDPSGSLSQHEKRRRHA
ncbi:MAG: rim15, signal transduction response regulator [Watsoniomyces obsoletus]|nr:MAG: rim15, signal transduction response regulator [Watsoniomyces obsoletus]